MRLIRKKEIKARINRLLSGEFFPDDVTYLYLSLRDKSHDIQSVKEIGDFIAHHGHRDKVFLTNQLSLFFRSVDLHFEMQEKGRIDIKSLSLDFFDIFFYNLNALEESQIKKNVGISKKNALLLVEKMKKMPLLQIVAILLFKARQMKRL